VNAFVRTSIFPLVLAATAVAAPMARADEAGPAGRGPGGEAGPRARDDGRRTVRRLPANLLRGAISVVGTDNIPAFIVGGMAAASASFLDGDTRQAAVGQLGWSNTFETAGGPVYSTLFVAGMFTAGRFTGSARFRAMTYDMLDAAVVNFTYTEVLKVAVGRERPNGEDHKSFPSGHTSQAFAMASVAQQHYGWKVGVPAYALAGLMGASRIHEDKHWLSDVVAGAALGYIAGRTVVRANDRPLERGAGAALSVSPIVARHARGMQMSLTF
jgi:membrane-associated phospholipid phosphatase